MLSEKVLVITLNANEANNIINMLEPIGYNMFIITNIDIDINKEIEKIKPDLVVMDITLEGNLHKEDNINKIYNNVNIPVVFLIALTGGFTLKRSIISETYNYLAKPFNERDLHAAIQIALYKKKMSDKLCENEQWYSTILKSIHEMVIITNKDRKVTFLNSASEDLTGWKMADAYGKDLEEVFKTVDDPTQKLSNCSLKTLWESIINELSVGKTADLKVKAKNGKETIIESSMSLIRGKNKEIMGVVFILRDITEKKIIAQLKEQMYEQQLIQADKLISLGTLVSGVAHEINNPNNFIMLNTPILEDIWKDIIPILEQYYEENDDFDLGGLNFSEMRNYIPKLFSGIFEGANRIKRIVADLKNFARQDPSEMNQLVDINFVIKSAVTLVAHQIKQATHYFTVNYSRDLPSIKGNYQRLEQVIINLVMNSCQALESPDKKLNVSTKYMRDKESIQIEIVDEGLGIPQSMISRILDPFFTTKRNEGGTGLGLSVSSGIIKDHRGSINFTSDEGKGTKVLISLPVSE